MLHVPQRLEVREVTDTEFDSLLRSMAGQQYHAHGTLGRELGGVVLEGQQHGQYSAAFQQLLQAQGATQAHLSQQANLHKQQMADL